MTSLIDWHAFNWVDYSIIGLTLLSTVISVMRGFIREFVSLATWVTAFVASIIFAPVLSESHFLTYLVRSSSLRLILAFVVLFVLIFLLGMAINFMLGLLVDKVKLTVPDKILGVFFGIARGILLVSIVVFLAAFTTMPRDQWWVDSQLIPRFKPLVTWFQGTFSKEIKVVSDKISEVKGTIKQPAKEKKDINTRSDAEVKIEGNQS